MSLFSINNLIYSIFLFSSSPSPVISLRWAISPFSLLLSFLYHFLRCFRVSSFTPCYHSYIFPLLSALSVMFFSSVRSNLKVVFSINTICYLLIRTSLTSRNDVCLSYVQMFECELSSYCSSDMW